MRNDYLGQLQSRPLNTLDAWGEDAEYRQFVIAVLAIVKREMGWELVSFVPWDPFVVVFWAYDDAYDLEAAVLAVEDLCGIDIPDEDIARWAEGDFGTFVAEMYRRKTR